MFFKKTLDPMIALILDCSPGHFSFPVGWCRTDQKVFTMETSQK